MPQEEEDEAPDMGPAWDWKVVRNDDPHDRDVPCVVNKLRVPGERVIKVFAGHHHSMCISLEVKKKSHRVCVHHPSRVGMGMCACGCWWAHRS